MTDERKIVHELRDAKERLLVLNSLKEKTEKDEAEILMLETSIEHLQAILPEGADGTFGIRVIALRNPQEVRHINDEITLRICEVHWNANGTLRNYHDSPAVQGDNLAEIKEYLQHCHDALEKPIYWGGERWGEIYIPESK